MKTHAVEVKLYLEGIPVDLISVDIQENLGSAPVAVVNLPPDPEMSRLLPKTIAHIFYRMKSPTGVREYYLIFEGELATVQFGRSQEGAGIQLTFLGLTNNWKNTYKGIVDFSLDSFMMGQFLLIGSDSQAVFSEEKYKKKDIDSDAADKVNFLMSKFPATNITAKLQQSLELFTKGEESDEALQNSFEAIINDLSKSNPYYGMIHSLYKIKDRIIALNNKQALNTIRGEVVSEIFLKSLTQLPNAVDGSQILATILRKLEHVYTEPAAPTLGEDGNPKSIFFVPETLFLMPLRCNTVFPDQIIQSGYGHDYSKELTRLVSSSPPISLSHANSATAFTMQPKFIVPQKDFYQLDYEGVKIPAIGMSPEEKLRGIVPYNHQMNEAQLAYSSFYSTYAKKDDKGNIEDSDAAYKGSFEKFRTSQLGRYMQSVNMWEFLRRKYAVRSFSVTTTYTPNRVVGFPGIVLDKKLPSVVGKIVSISSTLNANGTGSSNIVFQGPRSYKENDFDKNPDPWTGDTPLFNEFTDEWPGTPFWFDETYNADKIGETLKPIVDPTNNTKVTVDFHAGDFPTTTNNVSKDQVNVIAKSIFNLKKKYDIYDDKHLFIDKETSRNLITEEEFWKFLVGNKRVDYKKNDNYKSFLSEDIKYDAHTRILSYSGDKVFVKERRDQVMKTKRGK